jgi:FkbM family methyltransferase
MAWAGPLKALRRSAVDWRRQPETAVLDRLGRLMRGDACLYLPEAGGDFFLDPRSDLFRRLLASGRYEPAAIALLERHLDPSRDFVDVGANVGFFTVAAARRLSAGRVLAVEPVAAAHARLNRNIALNGLSDRVIPLQCLVGDRPGEGTIHVIPGREEYSSIEPLVHPSATGAATVVETCPMETLDRLVERHGLAPAMIKMDVEGAEGIVLAGARETLARHRPVVLAEFSLPLLEGFRTPPDTILESLRALGYVLSDPGGVGGEAGQRPYGELLAVPGGGA